MTHGRRRLLIALLLLTSLLLTVVPAGSAQTVDRRPDIVMVYLDDVAPHDGRLWDDPRRTPTLAALFAGSGVSFVNAISETPLCSPSRANILTGRHTANHGSSATRPGPSIPA